jgi:hypothetical protein
MSTDPWVWIASIGTIGVLSGILWKDNVLFRTVEHVFVGLSSAYYVFTAYRNLVNLGWAPLKEGKIILVIPMLLGLSLYTRFTKRYAYLSRWGMGFLIGVGSGLAMFASINAQLLPQIRANMLQLTSLNNIILVLGVLSIIVYFFFSVEQKGAVKHVSKIGRYMMMLTFGVSFGNVVQGRISLLLGVLESLLGKWLGLMS